MAGRPDGVWRARRPSTGGPRRQHPPDPKNKDAEDSKMSNRSADHVRAQPGHQSVPDERRPSARCGWRPVTPHLQRGRERGAWMATRGSADV